MLELLLKEYSLPLTLGAAGSEDGRIVWYAVKVMKRSKTVAGGISYMRTGAQPAMWRVRRRIPN